LKLLNTVFVAILGLTPSACFCVTGLDELVSWMNEIDKVGAAQLPELGEIGFPLDFHGA